MTNGEYEDLSILYFLQMINKLYINLEKLMHYVQTVAKMRKVISKSYSTNVTVEMDFLSQDVLRKLRKLKKL